MNELETAAIVTRLATAYNAETTGELLTLWHDHLRDLDTDSAFEATEDLIDSADGFFPTVARFRQAYAAVRRRDDLRTPALPASTGRVSPEAFRAGLEQARASLRRTSR